MYPEGIPLISMVSCPNHIMLLIDHGQGGIPSGYRLVVQRSWGVAPSFIVITLQVILTIIFHRWRILLLLGHVLQAIINYCIPFSNKKSL